MKNYKELISTKNVPSHVAIIMDGNGRWAKKKSLTRADGHRKGAEVIEPLMDAAIEIGIKHISLYAFSTENWMRPRVEVISLWKLLEEFFHSKIDQIKSKDIKIIHSGFIDKLPSSTKKTITRAVEETKKNKSLILNFCINYGGRQEIVKAVNDWIGLRRPNERLTLKRLRKNFFDKGLLPDVDLLIRTSGEYRISNYMIWQISYAELVFLDILWPEFRPYHLYKSIYEYQQRERRFGGL